MTLYSGEIPSNSAIVAAAEQIAALFHRKSPGPTTLEIAAVIGRLSSSLAWAGSASKTMRSSPERAMKRFPRARPRVRPALHASSTPQEAFVLQQIHNAVAGNLRAARSKTKPGDRSDNQLSRPGYQSTYAWAYLKHATERQDYHANTIAKMCPDDPDRGVKEEKERSLANFARILARDILASPTETLGDLDARAWLLLLETCPDQLPEAARRGDVNALPAGIRIKNCTISEVGTQAAVDIALAILRATAIPRQAHRSS